MKIQVIIGTTRQNRFSEKAAQWIVEETKKIKEIEVEPVDLKEYPMPFYDEAMPPKALNGEYPNPVSKKFAEKIFQADGYIMVTAEYNHGYPAALKNAMDYVYFPWNNKPVGFVSYGSVGGARAIEQLRLVAIELQMAPIQSAIHIPGPLFMTALKDQNAVLSDLFEPLNSQKGLFFEQLIWWTKALKVAREEKKK